MVVLEKIFSKNFKRKKSSATMCYQCYQKCVLNNSVYCRFFGFFFEKKERKFPKCDSWILANNPCWRAFQSVKKSRNTKMNKSQVKFCNKSVLHFVAKWLVQNLIFLYKT